MITGRTRAAAWLASTLAVLLLIVIPLRSALAESTEGLYVGLGVHETWVDVDIFDDSETSIHAALGYRFNRFVSTEFDMYDLGDFSVSGAVGPTGGKAEFKGWASGIAVVPRLPLWIFEIFARLGVNYYDVKVSAATGLGGVKEDKNGVNVYGGLGVGVNIGSHWSVYLDYTVLNAVERVDMAGLGARYHFE